MLEFTIRTIKESIIEVLYSDETVYTYALRSHVYNIDSDRLTLIIKSCLLLVSSMHVGCKVAEP